MFPVSNNAQSVVNALLNRLKELHVTIKPNCPVEELHYEDGRVKKVILKTGETIEAKAVVIAVGGKSVPHTGSTGDGYPWAKKAGHTITDLYPTEVPLTSDETFIQERILQGLSLQDISLSVLNHKGKSIITHRMDMIFTHFGISGPAVLRCSQFVVKELKKGISKRVTMKIDALPDQNEDMLFQQMLKKVKEEPKKAAKNALKGFVPERLLLFLMEKAGIEENRSMNSIAKEKFRTLAHFIKDFRFSVNGSLPIEKAFVTGGGVSIKEIEPKTMASKKMSGLYFSGEILDIHGYTGGFNITSALVTGRLAGMNAGQFAIQS